MVMVIPLPPASAKEQGGTMPSSIARVGTDGTYVLQNLAAVEYSVIAMLPGYLSPINDYAADMTSTSPHKQRDLLLRYGTVVVGAQETWTIRFIAATWRGGERSCAVLRRLAGVPS